MNEMQKQLYNYQIVLFDKIYSYMKKSLESELELETFEKEFKLKWIRTWMKLKKEYENSIRKQTMKIIIGGVKKNGKRDKRV